MPAQAAQKAVSYDEIPYESMSYPQTHPSHLYTVATLFGLKPPDFRKARVLEIGCAAGGNILPLALNYPKASFTGIDLSGEQIAHAERQKAALKVKNIEFRQEDILAFDLKKEKGRYDYIIVHGIFSWVPEPVRNAVLDICREALSDDGLAVVSYNTLPGWNAVRSLREMMLYHGNRFQKNEEKIVQSRALLEFLLEAIPESNAAYRGVIEAERKLLQTVPDSYIFHDHLEDVNAQFYLHDFVRMADERDLSYVGDVAVSTMFVGNMPAKALERLQAVDDVVAQEQYMDFVNNRRFRSTILCKKGRKLSRDLRAEQILDYNLRAAYTPAPGGTPASATFNAPNGANFSTQSPAATALFAALAAQGSRPIAAADLIALAAKNAGVDAALVKGELLRHGLQLMLRGFVSIHADDLAGAAAAGDKPVAWPLARLQAARPGCQFITNIQGGTVKTDQTGSILITHMDGTRDIAALADVLVNAIAKGTLTASQDGKPVTDGKKIRPQLEQSVINLLPVLARQNLLVK